MAYIVFGIHLVGLFLAPSGFRWLLAPQWLMAAVLSYYKPNDQDATAGYTQFFIAASALLIGVHRIVGLLAEGTPEPASTTLYSISIWLLGLSGMLAIGLYAYVLRMLFWERQQTMYHPRETLEHVLGSLKRQH